MTISDNTIKSWLDSKNVIEKFLQEVTLFDVSKEALDHNSSALIARLAAHDPPLLIVYDYEIKEDA
jgi:hypothetical protein